MDQIVAIVPDNIVQAHGRRANAAGDLLCILLVFSSTFHVKDPDASDRRFNGIYEVMIGITFLVIRCP